MEENELTQQDRIDRAKKLLPILRGLSVYEARMVLEEAKTQAQKAGIL